MSVLDEKKGNRYYKGMTNTKDPTLALVAGFLKGAQ